MGDGIASWIDDIKELYPGIFVHSVQIPEGGSPDEERRAGFVRVTYSGL
jgi:palmitoyl-protein thioesterase